MFYSQFAKFCTWLRGRSPNFVFIVLKKLILGYAFFLFAKFCTHLRSSEQDTDDEDEAPAAHSNDAPVEKEKRKVKL